MFGLTFEKLVVAALIAAVLLGPTHLPLYAHKLAGFVRAVRSFTDTARQRAAAETGLSLDSEDWQALDPRQYDPRRIMREALESGSTDAAPLDPDLASAVAASGSPLNDVEDAPAKAQHRYIVTGSSAHPRRTFVPIEPLVDETPSAA